MKKLLFIPLLLSFIISSGQPTDFFNKADHFMQQYVNYGLVDYESIHNHPESLNKLTDEISAFDIELADEMTLEAFYINTYNLLVIKQIIENYPLSSPMDIDGFFSKTTFNVASKNITLDQFENDIIRTELRDPRVHFVLVCGAQGCAPLPGFAYKPENIEQLLIEQTRKILNDGSFVILDTLNKRVSVSEIFKWYIEDFTKEGETVIDYINGYREEKILSDYVVTYYPYDWKTNSQ